LPAGWSQVDAIVTALRAHYTPDRDASAPADDRDVVAHFLLESHRGPDYLFASAAVVLLRSLGYPARLVSGLYADPGRYDSRSRHTPVTGADVHFWAEVVLPGGMTIAIEPTPGYHLMGPARSWTERVVAALRAAGRWANRHPAGIGLALLGLAFLVHRRREALDLLATLRWRIDPGRSWRRRVLMTLRLLESRSRRAGRPRPPGQTFARWYGPIAVPAGEVPDDLNRLVRLADWAIYAPGDVQGQRALIGRPGKL
jgi:hypothetical protein